VNDQIGYRDVGLQPLKDDLRYRLESSPTGRQLASDGNLILPVVTYDPATTTNTGPDGLTVYYYRATVLEQWGFTRAEGWQQV